MTMAYCKLELFCAEKYLQKYQEIFMEKFLQLEIVAKIHHDRNHYITIEFFCDFDHSQIFAKNSVTSKFQPTVCQLQIST